MHKYIFARYFTFRTITRLIFFITHIITKLIFLTPRNRSHTYSCSIAYIRFCTPHMIITQCSAWWTTSLRCVIACAIALCSHHLKKNYTLSYFLHKDFHFQYKFQRRRGPRVCRTSRHHMVCLEKIREVACSLYHSVPHMSEGFHCKIDCKNPYFEDKDHRTLYTFQVHHIRHVTCRIRCRCTMFHSVWNNALTSHCKCYCKTSRKSSRSAKKIPGKIRMDLPVQCKYHGNKYQIGYKRDCRHKKYLSIVLEHSGKNPIHLF